MEGDKRQERGKGGRGHCTVHVVYMYPTGSASYGEIPNWAEALGPTGSPCAMLPSAASQQVTAARGT